jgi:hypothetical protein
VRRTTIGLLVSLVVVAASAVATPAAGALVWKFDGTELTGSETVVGAAVDSSLTVPGATTECKDFLLNMKITNDPAAKGEITEAPLFECSTSNPACTVESIEAEKLPWQAHAVTILSGASSGGKYVVIEGIHIGIVYSGALCSLAGAVEVRGTAGGLFNNATSSLKFDKATFEATGTELKVGSTSVEWNAEFLLEAFGTHAGEKLELG